MAGATKTCRGIILTSREHKDKDRILKFLTRDEGLIDIYVKGSGKLNSHSAFTSVPYMLCDLTYTVSGNYNFLKSGAIVESNSRLMTDFALKYFLVSLSVVSESFSRSFFSSLALIFAAAALVNVMTRTFSTESSLSRILLTILSVMTVVFPEPAAALTRIFPEGASTISFCSLLKPMITPPFP